MRGSYRTEQVGPASGGVYPRRVLAVAFCAVVAFATPARAESLWERRDPRCAFLFEDTRARHVGDLLTIVVRESTDIGQREKRALDKQSESGGLFNFKGKTVGNASSKGASA